jgi:FKBP-type peptidyl-prolyl cis-trans isomerase FkpA
MMKIKSNNMSKSKSRIVLSFLVIIMVISTVSCDVTKKYREQEKKDIAEYLAQNSNLSFVKQASGLYYLNVLTGTGLMPAEGDSAYVYYTGKFLDGTVFDTNVGSRLYGFKAGLGYNIAGFDEGIMLMKAGGKSSLLIPSSLAYGAAGVYMGNMMIPSYTPILFDIQMVKVVPK